MRDVSESTRELLLAEHRYVGDSFWRNEEAGEKRVNFFITLVTAVLAALVALATKQGSLTGGQVRFIAFAACLSLLAVGTLTFRRLIQRNLVTDHYKHSMDLIRDQFRAWDRRELEAYNPFPKSAGTTRSFGRGGLTDLVAVVNSVVGASAVAVLAAASGRLAVMAVVAAVGFVLFLATHAAYLEHSYRGTWLHPLWRRFVTWLRALWRRFVPGRQDGNEVESALVVIMESSEVLRSLEGLNEIAGHPLAAAQLERIHDRYVDTTDGKLEEQRIALRVRELDGREFVTLKGPSLAGSWGVESRLEFERDWSEEAWLEIRGELERRGIEIAGPSTGRANALETLEAAELETVQDREVERRARNVMARSGGRTRIAELALDTVTYHFTGRDVRHYEVEIEAKARRGDEAVAAIKAALIDQYWPRLRPWRHGKLPTGKAVRALIDAGRVDEVVANDGALRPQAYDAIAEELDGSA